MRLEELDDAWGTAIALGALGGFLAKRCDAAAEECAQRSLAVHRQLGDR